MAVPAQAILAFVDRHTMALAEQPGGGHSRYARADHGDVQDVFARKPHCDDPPVVGRQLGYGARPGLSSYAADWWADHLRLCDRRVIHAGADRVEGA